MTEKKFIPLEKPLEYYLDLIKNGEELTPVENSNAKKLLRKGYVETLEIGKAVVRRNRDLDSNWNDWFYNRFQVISKPPARYPGSYPEIYCDGGVRAE